MTFNDQFVFFGKCSYLEKLYLLVLQGFWCDVEKQKLQTIYILTKKWCGGRLCYGSRLLSWSRDSIFCLSFAGKAQTAAVKRDAEIGVAQANRDAGIREAECEKAAMDVKYNTDTKIEDNSRAFKLQKAHFDKEVNTAVKTGFFTFGFKKVSSFLSGSSFCLLLQKAEAQLAYELQAAKIQQKIRNEEIQIQVRSAKKINSRLSLFRIRRIGRIQFILQKSDLIWFQLNFPGCRTPKANWNWRARNSS